MAFLGIGIRDVTHTTFLNFLVYLLYLTVVLVRVLHFPGAPVVNLASNGGCDCVIFVVKNQDTVMEACGAARGAYPLDAEHAACRHTLRIKDI
jgi:hypothetical protein